MKYEIIKFVSDNVEMEINVSPEEDTVWVSKEQMSILFERDRSVISRHIKNIFGEKELEEKSNVHFLHIANSDKPVPFYSLDVVISVGYRVKSTKAVVFRRWANSVLKEYLLKGYIVNENRVLVTNENYINLINKVNKIECIVGEVTNKLAKIEDTMSNNDIPEEILFNEGQYYSAAEYLIKLIRSAKISIDIVDEYADYKITSLLSNKKRGVEARLLVGSRGHLDDVTIDNFNKEYGDLEIRKNSPFHDRYFIIDKKAGYHLGPSVNYMGKKISESMKMNENLFVEYVLMIIDDCFKNEN